MIAEPFQSGVWTISVLKEGDDDCPALEFLDELRETDQNKFLVIFQMTIDHGPPRNKKKFKKLEGNIWEFKADSYRLLAFMLEGERHIIITHGFKKEKRWAPRRELQRAENMRADYLNQLGVQE